MVIAEAAYLIERELGTDVERLLYDSIIAGDIIVEHLTIDWKRTAELVTRNDSLPLGGTDAEQPLTHLFVIDADSGTLDDLTPNPRTGHGYAFPMWR